MKKNKKKYPVILIVLCIIAILGVLAIWVQSMLPKEISEIESDYIYKLIKTPLKAIFVNTYVGTTFVRKLAHKVEYAFIGGVITLLLLF